MKQAGRSSVSGGASADCLAKYSADGATRHPPDQHNFRSRRGKGVGGAMCSQHLTQDKQFVSARRRNGQLGAKYSWETPESRSHTGTAGVTTGIGESKRSYTRGASVCFPLQSKHISRYWRTVPSSVQRATDASFRQSLICCCCCGCCVWRVCAVFPLFYVPPAYWEQLSFRYALKNF